MQKKTKRILIILLHFFLVLPGHWCAGRKLRPKVKKENNECRISELPKEKLVNKNFVKEKPIKKPEASISEDKESSNNADYDLVKKSSNTITEPPKTPNKETENKENEQQELANSKNRANTQKRKLPSGFEKKAMTKNSKRLKRNPSFLISRGKKNLKKSKENSNKKEQENVEIISSFILP